MRFPSLRIFHCVSAACLAGVVFTQSAGIASTPDSGCSAMKKPGDLIQQQEPPKVSPRVLERVTRDNAHVVISIGKQRAFLILGGEIAIDTPVSTGKAAGMTPTGSYRVLEKDANHRSSFYGNFVDTQGRVVRGGVSTRIDSAPSGSHFDGAPMKWFIRFSESEGLYVGPLPGYPAAQGCIRVPEEIAAMIYEKVKVGTPVDVVQ